MIGRNLRNGNTRSCGCLHDEVCAQKATKHGHANTREYRAWSAAKTRCFNPNTRTFKDYGGRGITMCDRWRDSFPAFLIDMGPCPRGHSVERIDVNGHYEPGNCRWASRFDQANNTRVNHVVSFNGRVQTIAQWERDLDFKPGTLKRRLLLGWPIHRAMTEPLRQWPGRMK